MRRIARRRSHLLLIAAVGLLVVGCGTNTARRPVGTAKPRGTPSSPRPATDFTFTALDGTEISLSKLRGKPVVLNFWASYCAACARMAPHLQDLYEEHESEGLQVLGISPMDSKDALKKKADALGVTYPVGISTEAARAYAVRAVPMTFFIDREGSVVAMLFGAQSADTVEAEAEKIL